MTTDSARAAAIALLALLACSSATARAAAITALVGEGRGPSLTEGGAEPSRLGHGLRRAC